MSNLDVARRPGMKATVAAMRSSPYAFVVTETGSCYMFAATPSELEQNRQYQGLRTPERPLSYDDGLLQRSSEIVAQGPVRKGDKMRFYIGPKAFDSSPVVSIEYRSLAPSSGLARR